MNKKEIEKLVESWNWNLNIFEIYDELEQDHPDKGDQRKILNECASFFNDDYTRKLVGDLASHLGVDIA